MRSQTNEKALDSSIEKTHTGITHEKQIKKLKEYKATLIGSLVTGKMRV